jgi:hypothetical protein
MTLPEPSWHARAWALVDEIPIYVGKGGQAIGDRPTPYEFEGLWEFLLALQRYRDQIANALNQGFAREFRKAV